MFNTNEIEERFKFHPPRDKHEMEMFSMIRERCMDLAASLTDQVSDEVMNSREWSLFLTNVEQAMFWANAAYARHK